MDTCIISPATRVTAARVTVYRAYRTLAEPVAGILVLFLDDRVSETDHIWEHLKIGYAAQTHILRPLRPVAAATGRPPPPRPVPYTTV